MYSLFVGVDVSKDFFSAVGLDKEGQELFSGTYEMNSKGFSEFLKTISSHGERRDQVMVAMESTGCYHINLFSFLTFEGICTVVMNPLLISNFAKLSLRKTKTDKKDAKTIARFLVAHQGSISQLSLSQDLQDLRDLSRERESLCHQMAATKVEIKRVLRATFPELESIGNFYTRVMLRFLHAYPSARLVRAAKPRAIAKALKRSYVGNKLTFSSEDILWAARSSVAVGSPAKQVILQAKISTLLHLNERLEQVMKPLTDLCKATRIEDLEILTSIKGVGPKTAAPFLAEMGPVENFTFHKKLIAFAGWDPSVRQSGNFVGISQIG